MTDHCSHASFITSCSCEASSCQTSYLVQAALTHAFTRTCLREEEQATLEQRSAYETYSREYALYQAYWRKHQHPSGDGSSAPESAPFQPEPADAQPSPFLVSTQQMQSWRGQRPQQLKKQLENIRTRLRWEEQDFEQACKQFAASFQEACAPSLLQTVRAFVCQLKKERPSLSAELLAYTQEQGRMYERYLESGRSLVGSHWQARQYEGTERVFRLSQEHAYGYRLHTWDLAARTALTRAQLSALAIFCDQLDLCLIAWSYDPAIVSQTQPRTALLRAFLPPSF